MSSIACVHWHCPNRDCNWSFVATIAGEGAPAPRCVCGGLMQKAENLPVFRYLDFLREVEPTKKDVEINRE